MAVTPFRRPNSERADDMRSRLDGLLDLCRSEEAEQALLGSILANNRGLEAVSDFLRPEHFGIPVHGRLYSACLALAQDSRIANPTSLRIQFEDDADLAKVGGAGYLTDLIASAFSGGASDPSDAARIIIDMWKRREGMQAIRDAAMSIAFPDRTEPAEAPLAALSGAIETLQMEAAGRRVGPQRLATVMHEFQAFLAAAPERQRNALNTGLADLDAILGSILQPDLIILGARPGMGKSTLMRHVALHVAHRGKRVPIFTCEMSSLQVAMGFVQRSTSIAVNKMKSGDVLPNDVSRMVQVACEMSKLPIYLDDASGLTVEQMIRRVRQLQQMGPIDLVCIDYLQLMRDSRHRSSKDPNRVQEVSAISEGLKAAAKDLQVPILALSQLSRQLENRTDKRPQLADLRESGSIEQDADTVLFLYREEEYVKRAQPGSGDLGAYQAWCEQMDRVQNLAEVIVAKNRSGETGVAKMRFDGARGLFEGLARGFQGDD